MSLAQRVTTLMASLTPGQVLGMSPVERQLLANQCERLHRLVHVQDIAQAARIIAKTGVLAELKQEDGR